MFHFLGFSFVDAVKLVFACAFILSGITMYLWLREFLGENAGVIGAILYNFAPYRFVDLYVRGAIGEHVAFVFPPLVCYFLLKIAKDKQFNRIYSVGLSLSLAGLVLSHNALLIMFLPFIAFYAFSLILNSEFKKKLSLNYLSSLALGFGSSLFFLYPAFSEGKYTLRDIVTGTEYASRFVNINQLFYGPWSYGISGQFTVQIGIVQIILVAVSLFGVKLLFKKKQQIAACVFDFLYLFYWLSILNIKGI